MHSGYNEPVYRRRIARTRSYFHEADVSAQQSQTEPKIRIPGQNENPGGAACFKAPAGKRQG